MIGCALSAVLERICLKRYSKEIQNRLKEFRKPKNDKEIFCELAFCLLTPQSRARVCWDAVTNLVKKDILLIGTQKQIRNELTGVRFKNKKAVFICEARRFFNNGGLGKLVFEREWLVKNIKGMGYKEASHFLRNIGIGLNLAILDRHILKNLKELGVIKDIPGSLTRKRYLEIEKKMGRYAKRIKMPMGCLDLVLWSKETGEVFK